MLRYLCVLFTASLLLTSGQFSVLSGQSLLLEGHADEQLIIDKYPVSVRQSDSLSVSKALSKWLGDIQKEGYFQASASVPVKIDSNSWKSSVTVGPRYRWAMLSPGNLSLTMLEKSGFREHFFLDRPFSYQEIQKLMAKVIEVAENEGYPFASVRLKNIQIEKAHVRAEVDYQPGPYITFGPLQIQGSDKVKANFLSTQLRIPEGSAYSQKKINQIPQIISTLPYLQLTEDVALSFQNDEVEVHLILADRKSSEVDGLINFLPNENVSGRLLLTGRASLLLNNLMGSGKQLSLKWQRLQVESQQLSLSYKHPFLFKTPLQADISFQLLKEDTLFLNRRLGLSLALPLAQRGMIGLETTFTNSNQLGGSSANNELVSAQIKDLQNFSTALLWHYNRLNHLLYPSKGYRVQSKVGLGRKSISSAVGEGGETDFWQPWIELTFGQYHRVGKVWVLHHRLSAAYLHADQLFLNELFRVGGLNSLRGFNDNFFFASYYAISNLEWRMLLEQTEGDQSYLYVFYDQAFMGNALTGSAYRDMPSGIGAGLSFSSRAGIFNLAYALGRTNSVPFNPSLSRIHFGYTSRF